MASGKRLPKILDKSSSGHIGHLVVGDEPCTFVEVRDVLYRCASAGKLWSRLLDIAKSLEIPTDSIISLETRIPTKMTTYPGALLEILEGWRGKFSTEAKLKTLINVLESNDLADCADALWIHFNDHYDAYVVATLEKLKSTAESITWETLPDYLKHWMNSKAVIFQGNKSKLEELTAQIATTVDEKILDELGEGRTPCIVNKQVPDHLEYYVHRTVTSRNILKLDVLKQTCKDVFIIEGMEKYQLSSLVPDDESTDVSGNQLEKLTVRFILLQHSSDFDKISRVENTPVHWVKYGNGRLELARSSGSVTNLQKHIHDSKDSFSEEELARRAERVVVIADSPGMGKTCLLANIAHQIMREQPNLVVRFIVLKEFVDALSSKKINTESIVKQIAERSSEYEFGRKLVEHALKTQKCVLLFDGLDEVLSNQMTVAMEILKAAATLPSAQVYVATRPHFRDDVENELNVLAHTIQPFEVSNQINFLTKFWTIKGAFGNDDLTKFTNKCVNQVNSMTDSERKIAGIPLQCRLLAEAYEEHAIRCSKTGFKDYEGADSFVIINSMFKIYQRHMNMRFEKIRKQESLFTRFLPFLTKRNQYDTIKQAHMYFALKLLFPEHAKKFKCLNKSSIPLNELCGLGILEATNSNEIRFVHRTFAEFLVAMLAHEYMQTNYKHRDILISSLLELSWEDLEIDNPVYPYNFINDYTEFRSFDFNFPVICYFLNGFRKNETGTEIAIDYHDEAIPYYIASAYHNYETIPSIVTRFITNINPIEIDAEFKRNLFYVIANHSSLELMKKFCSIIDITQINFMSFEKSYESAAFIITLLHLAVQRGHYTLVDYLLKKLEGKVSQRRYLMHFCVNRSARESNAIVDDKIQIIKLLVNKNKHWIDEQLPDQTAPLMQNYVHVELLECLINEGANLNIRDKYGNTVLHAITKKNEFTPESYHRVLNALNQRGFQHFNEPDLDHNTPLHLAVEKIDLLSITLELFISKGPDFNAVNIYNNTALHTAVIFKRSEKILDSLIKAGADENARGQYNRTVLHRSAIFGNLTALKFFILRGHGVNVTDEEGCTPLHLAVKLSKTNTHEVVVLLVEHGADVNAIDKFRRTPLSIAKGGQSKVEARTKEYLEIANMELLLMKWELETIQHNMDKLSTLTNFDSGLLQKLTSSGILTERDVDELESNETGVSRANKLFKMLLTTKYDIKILLSAFSDSNNGAVLNIFVKELISYLYKALMNLEVTGVNHVMHTKGYSDLLDSVGRNLEEIDRQPYSDKLSIVQFICTLSPQVSRSRHSEMYTPGQPALSHSQKQNEFIQRVIAHNLKQSEIQDLIYMCLGNTHEHLEVNERKRIISNILQNHPSLFQNQPKYYPLLAPNIHVDLIIHVINLRVNVNASNQKKQNLLNLCAGYLTPEEYHRVVNALVEKQQTELLHSRDENQYSQLHFAVAYLELLDSTIQLFSSAKVDFNAVDKYNDTALHNAVLSKRSERILDSLIKAGADENARGQYNLTVVHRAASYGNLTALKYFILRGHDVNVTDEEGSTPLHRALALSKTKTHEVVMLLVEHGADVNAINKFGRTPLFYANGSESEVESRTKEYLESIIKQDAMSKFIKCHSTIIRKNRDKLIAVTNFESGLPQRLTSCRILTEPEFKELGPFETSASRANKFYTMLLTRKSDFKILLSAFSDSNNEAVLRIFVKELISYLYNVLMNLEVTGVHHIMNTKGYADLLLRFVDTLEDIDRQEYAYKFSIVVLLCTLNPQILPRKGSGMCSPLQLALFFHHEKQLEFIQMIIAHQVDVNERDDRGLTPIQYAVRQRPFPPRVIEIVKLLIEIGADPDAVDQQGCTFMHRAPNFLTPELYDELILFFDSSGRKDSLKMLDLYNNTHLHCAVYNFEALPSTLNIFKSNGIDFNWQDIYGHSVVFNAIVGGRNTDFLNTLMIEYKADWKILNKKQENALHLAAMHGNVSALELFISLGCDVNAKNTLGRTPLHNAFLPKDFGKDTMTKHEIVVMLLKENVNVTAIESHGKTPIDLAKERLKIGKVKQETVEVLEKYSSK